MGRNKDNLPIGNTCPMIDDVIRDVKDLHSYYGMDMSEDGQEEVDRIKNNALSVLEDIRGANSTLRDWGNEQYSERDELYDKCSEYEKQIHDLEHDLSKVEDRVEKLEDEIEVLEDKLYNLNNQQ